MLKTIRVPIEVDITYTNKTWYSKRPRKIDNHYVMGFFQRNPVGKGVAKILTLENNNPETIHELISKNVAAGSILFTEENLLPESLVDLYEIYELTASDGHANGDLHVNNVKNMWRDLKRNIKREHVSVSKKHLQGYCDEVAWRINTSHLSPQERFEDLLSNVGNGNHVTYKELTDKK